ncbi:DNA cross-link repair protein, putative [Eimeria praecox]|uniref:DNA cross-link repair protein, putative n=1 Tax=Eimeria praecox TaxID=51316 RepID=U6GSI4_9EIME|nr:DNA cross-link repair protein, putative [Eimeria praecox]
MLTTAPLNATANMMNLQVLQEAGDRSKVRFLVGTYTIGKERIALHLARCCHLRIFVAPQRRRVFSCLELPPEDLALFTDNPQDAQIDLVPMNVCGLINRLDVSPSREFQGNSPTSSNSGHF